jgi:DNA-directed RNA polymerase subunit RPC12/RpoP
MTRQRQLHLVLDFIPDEALAKSARARPRQATLTVPEGVSYLSRGETGELQIAPAAPAEPSNGGQLMLEPIGNGQQPKLLLISRAGEQVLVNGQAALQLCVLGERDQFQFDDDVLHVVVHHQPHIGPPSADSVGTECPVCRTRLEADTRVYACVKCGTAIHLQGAETPPETRLECALMVSDCPHCGATIEMAAGYAWQPEFYSG